MSDWSVLELQNFGLFGVPNEAIPTVPPEGQTEEWKALIIKAANVPKWAQHSRESIWELGKNGNGAGKGVMQSEMYIENDNERSGKRATPGGATADFPRVAPQRQ
jgi:hypothetical protein